MHKRRLFLAAIASLVLHALLVPMVVPLREELPLVRHIGYRGERRILPEISVLREPGVEDSDVETMAGDISRAAFEVIAIEIVDWSVPEEGSADLANDLPDRTPGDALLDRLETSLPQPRSTDVVISHLVEPEYPASSIAAGVEGVATFRLHVSTTGDVRRAWLLSSEVDEACNAEAYRAIMQWSFEPYLVNGRPMSILVDQRIRFRLRDALRARAGGD
ncbi:MAG: energy transducer TonB [Candidatus Eisenbacteria bacterium]|nr:energy transducer TonB [Candidatus Eisenbacteria bacterium]